MDLNLGKLKKLQSQNGLKQRRKLLEAKSFFAIKITLLFWKFPQKKPFRSERA
jgi:hypothetical protein